MSRRGRALGVAGALLALALPGPSSASWAVPGDGTAQATTTAVGRPTALSQTAATTSAVTLSWRAPAGAPTDAYVVRRDGRAVPSCTGPATTCTDVDLAPGTSYRYTVTAALGAWRGRASAATTATTATSAAP